MRRIIAMLLAIVMLVGNVPVQAFATEDALQETAACITEGCTYGVGHTGECSNFVPCGTEGCTYASGHEGNCSNYAAPPEPVAEPAADADITVTVSNRGQLALAYEVVTVSDVNKDGRLSLDEALYAVHTTFGKGYASEEGTVTKLWDVETSNVSFFVNHDVVSNDVNAETIGSGSYLVASVDQDAANDSDMYSRFTELEKTVKANESFTLNLTDDQGNPLAGMEIGLWNGDGSTTMLGLTTDVNGSVSLTLDQEGLYCVTAAGTVVETAIDLNTMEQTSIEAPILAPVCVVTVSGVAEVTACSTEGCTYTAGHEGNCSNYVAPTKIRTAGNNRSSNSVTVGFTVVDCLDHNIEIMRKELTVTPGLAQEYFPDGQYGGSVGLTTEVGENDVTPIDVLVAAHLDEYGEAFTAAPYDYITGFDYVSKMFGENSEITWTANGNMPYVENEYGGTGYAINQYIVKNGDEIGFYRMSWFSYPANVYASFDRVEAMVNAGEELTLRLGYCATMDYRVDTFPAANAEIYYLNADGSLGDSTGYSTNEDGVVTLSFEQAGTYYLTCMGEVDYMDMMGNSTSVLSPAYIKITVTPAQCQHTNTTTTYTPVAGQTKHTVTVTCDACGEPTQTATTEDCVDEDNNNACDRCDTALPVAVESVSLDQETLTMTLGDDPIQLTATVNPDNATDKSVTWTTSNATVATANNGVVTAVGAGTATITVTTADGGKTATCAVTVKATVPSYSFTLTVGDETLEITDLGTTVTCTKTNQQAKEMSVTVPAGTNAVKVNSINNSVVMMYPDHGDQQTARENGSVELSIGTESYLCLMTVSERVLYHIYIKVAPCETHSWTDATCETPKTCSVCGATEGEADPDAHNYVNGTCEYCGEAEPVPAPSYTVKISEAEELTAGLNYFASVPAEGMDLIIDFGSGTISGAMCQRHCSKRDIWTAGEGSTFVITADKVAAHYCNETQRAKVAEDFDLYLTEGSKLIAFYWWTTANLNGSYLYLEILPAEELCTHETWNDATCTTPRTCANCGETEGEADPDAHNYVDGTCEYCGEAELVATPSYTVKISEAEELTAGLNYFASVPAEGMDLIIDFGSGTISGAMCQRHCSKRDIWTAGEGSTFVITADKVAAHYCNETQRAKVASDFNLYLTEGSKLIAFYWWTTANLNGSYLYLEILPAETDEGGGDDIDRTYNLTLPKNPVGYSIRATAPTTVNAGGEFSFKLNIFGEFKKTENFKVLANGVELTSTGNDNYTITNVNADQTVTVEGIVEKTLAEKNVTVNVPAGSTVTSGLFYSYFKYDFVDALEVTTLDDGRVQYIFPAASGGDAFIRVQHPDGVTYWDFGDLNVGKIFDITEEMLFIGSSEYTKKTVYANYEKNGHDTASLYLTANAQGWIDMNSGDIHSLNVFRNWIPVSNSTSNTGVSLPDVTYTVVDVNGNPSSGVVTITPDANNSCYADIQAVGAGTAIILVTYDAVYNADGEGGKQFSAIWPENTGVIVVTVDAADAGIQTNITVNEEVNTGGKQVLDVEHDILFYVGNEGAEYSFKPESGCTVSVARSRVGATMTFSGFNTNGVEVAEDGTVTLSGLTTGAHIVKVEKDGKTAYQVIRAREVNYVLTHSDGTEVTSGNPAQPGETITVQFSRLIDPMGKLSGVYNAKYGFRYVDEAGTVISISSSSAYGEYYFGSNPARQRFNVTVPAEWANTTYTLSDGSITLGGWGSSFGAHRATSYLEGKEPNLNASGTAGYASVLPEITIQVENEIHATEITLNHTSLELDVGQTADLVAELKPAGAVDDVVWTSGNTAVVSVTKDGKVTAVSAGTAKIIATAGMVTAECSVTVYELPESEATVYFSVSHDASFLKMDQTNKVVALQKLTVPYFDLALYGLEQYKVDRTNPVYGKPTMLHLYLYATEVLWFGVPAEQAGQGYLYTNDKMGTDVITITGDPGSLFMKKFWGMNENLNYYHNYEYPADATGYGMTADRVALKDGDIVTIGHFTSWSFHSDPRSVFNYLAAGEATVETTAVQNQEITLKLYLAGANLGNGGENAPVQEALNIYYTKADALSSGDVTTWTLLGTTDANGELKAAMPEAGTFILAVAGQKGTTYTNDIVSAPGGIILNVTESGTDDPVKRVISLIDDIGDVTLDKEDKIKQAREEYAKLSSALQKNVSNYNKLTEAEQTLEELANHAEISNVVNLIEKIGSLTPEIQDDVEAAREAYDELTEEQKNAVSNYAELLAAEKYLQLLEISGEDIANIYQTTGSYLSGLEAPTVGSTNGEWRVIGLARAGLTVADSYYNAVVSYVQTNIDSNERLHDAKATENARVILALTAIGKDVTDVGGHNLLRGLNDMTYIRNQGINGPLWTLIALDSHNYTPVGITRQDLLNEILGKQLSDGGWSMGTTSDVDMTAMAIQALAPYYSKDTTVKAAVDKALSWLYAKQNTDGSFSGSEGTTSESLAQVITALTAMGINPETNTRFVKNGISTIDALAAFYVEGGGFRHGTTGDRNMMATEQGYYALVSYFRLLEERTSLYDMSDVTIETSAANQAAANEVIALINAIGTVDLTKEDEITAARAAYNALTDAQKELVTNYGALTAAEQRLADLTGTEEDRTKVQEVKDLIGAIGTVTLSRESAITAARSAYNRLTTKQQNLLGSAYLKKLTDAESALADLKQAQADEAAASAVEQRISAIGSTITLGSESKISAARNAYNALTADQKALVSNYQTLVNAENALNVLKSTVSVTFSLLGCYKHGTGESSVHTLAGGNLQTWIAAKTYKVQPGATVKDLFEKALREAGLSWSNPTGNYVESITYNGQTVGEFTNGQKSGWMYTLNGKHPNLGVAQQTLVNGDVVVFHYTDDYTKEEGSTSSGTTSGGTTSSGTTNYITTTTTKNDTATAEAVDRLIEDIGEEITLDSAEKVKAARAAYDKLTEAQKKLVKMYEDLVAAEKKLAELKGVYSVDIYAETGDYIQGLGTPGVGAIGGEWMVIGLARSGRTVPTGYYDHVLNYVRENINDAEQLHSAKSSDNSRVILALTSIGKDVTNVDGHDLLKGLNSMDYIQKQGINGPIWALMAFDSGNYPVPEGDVSREKLIDVILEAKLDDGGWAMSGERSDPDLTGMAVQALVPYMQSNLDVKKAVEDAIWTLSKMQNDNGSFSSVDGPSSESIAQVIVALAALDIDADTDARFVKNGISAMDALLTYFVPGGGFRHVLDGNLDGMATEQAYYALVAYNRMKQNQTFLYDMTDVIDRGGDVVIEETTEPIEMATEPVVEEEEDNGNTVVIWTGVMTLCAGAIVVILLNRKKLFGKFM